MIFIGTKEQLLENGFEYVEEFQAHVRHCEYTRDEHLYKDIFCVHDIMNDVCVDIPKYCTNDVYKEIGKDLIEKGLLVEESTLSPHARLKPIYQKIRQLQDDNFEANEKIEFIKTGMKYRNDTIGGLLVIVEELVKKTVDKKFKDEETNITTSIVKSKKVLVDEELLINLKAEVHKEYQKTTVKFELSKFKKAFKDNEEMYDLGILKDETKETLQFRDNKYKGGKR